ncbi:MAG TPA: peptidoglycan-associated lipoprotein [Acetobacteraceae bacterium]|jgi:peptidoglycan-associated lipoprotein|nr:peptidoglycan-associated lipoprotein [Acetobacteraceae bacterium]
MTSTSRMALVLVAMVGGCATEQGAVSSGPAPVAGQTIVPGSQEDLVKNVGDRVFFDFDHATIAGNGALTRNNVATLDHQAAWLSQYNRNNVQIAGNCDERGTEEYNLALGQRRADAARGYLIAKGVADGRVTTISYGKERPTAMGSNEDAWSQNRNAITSLR